MRSTGSIQRHRTLLQRRADTAALIRSRVALRSQAGLTLIELLVAIAIIGAMGAAAVGATFQLLNASRQANDEQLAISQVRSTEHWITRDTLTSQTVTPDAIAPSGFPLVLTWESFDGTSNTVTYSMLDSPSGSQTPPTICNQQCGNFHDDCGRIHRRNADFMQLLRHDAHGNSGRDSTRVHWDAYFRGQAPVGCPSNVGTHS